jgi:hypothetical protein
MFPEAVFKNKIVNDNFNSSQNGIDWINKQSS